MVDKVLIMDLAFSIKVLEDQIKAKKEKSKRLKEGFIKNISHEVRTPLNIILGFSDLLLEKEGIEEMDEKYLSYISIGCKKLVSLLEENEISSINSELPGIEN